MFTLISITYKQLVSSWSTQIWWSVTRGNQVNLLNQLQKSNLHIHTHKPPIIWFNYVINTSIKWVIFHKFKDLKWAFDIPRILNTETTDRNQFHWCQHQHHQNQIVGSRSSAREYVDQIWDRSWDYHHCRFDHYRLLPLLSYLGTARAFQGKIPFYTVPIIHVRIGN